MDPAGPSDESLAARARGGDEEAFGALVVRYRERLTAAATHRIPAALRARVSSQDVVQECLVAAHGRLPDFEDRGPGSFGHWVLRILEHKVRDQIRDHLGRERRDARRDVAVGSSPDGGPFVDGARSPASLLHAQEEVARALDALRGLPEAQQAILRLVHQGGMKVAVASAQMGRTPGAGRKLYARGIASLAKALRTGRDRTR